MGSDRLAVKVNPPFQKFYVLVIPGQVYRCIEARTTDILEPVSV